MPSSSPSYADKPGLFPMRGGCACGHVRYELRLPPILVHCCHCTACQRQGGSAFAINAIVEADAIAVVSGPEPKQPESGSQPAAAAADSLLPYFARLTLAMPCHALVGDGSGSKEKKQDDEETKPLAGANSTAKETGAGDDAATTTTAAAAGRPHLVTVPTESGIGQTIACCPRCHTGLWNHYADAGPCLAYLRVGTLDGARHVDPDVHIFTRSRRAFVAIADGRPQFEDYYPDRAAFYRPDVLARVAALEDRRAAYRADLKAALAR
ncbi:glutathione-dependent formaldehyde-activating [Purpureocillium lavendulum]|uniref:Glutathione-dependent formaldehyde-activating n=1 Tax=Purpureocillium lavendulum TaxID=1247861 RepID=A0AB34G2Q5_9HYPO|nr:glutathione-dependent formaldehyde-activating [Purpureocillium lavendulum]